MALFIAIIASNIFGISRFSRLKGGVWITIGSIPIIVVVASRSKVPRFPGITVFPSRSFLSISILAVSISIVDWFSGGICGGFLLILLLKCSVVSYSNFHDFVPIHCVMNMGCNKLVKVLVHSNFELMEELEVGESWHSHFHDLEFCSNLLDRS